MVTTPLTALTFLKGYLSFLRDEGWAVTLVCSDGVGIRELVLEEGARFEPIRMRREPAPLHDIGALIRAAVLLRRIRPEVLVYATPKASLIGSISGALVGVPRRIYEVWGLRLETVQGARRALYSCIEKAIAHNSTRIVANSKSLARRMQQLGIVRDRQVTFLGHGSSHGVDAQLFARSADMPHLDRSLQSTIEKASSPVVGFIGRLHPDKGIDVLFKALAGCAQEGLRFQVLIVGPPEGIVIEPLADALGPTIPVHIVGHVADTRPYLRAMDLLVLPSRREGFPNVVLEAACMEVPAIVSDATGCRDSVIDGSTGKVIPTGDHVALAAAISELVVDADARSLLGRSAREWASKNFVPEDVWAAHSAIWKGSE